MSQLRLRLVVAGGLPTRCPARAVGVSEVILHDFPLIGGTVFRNAIDRKILGQSLGPPLPA